MFESYLMEVTVSKKETLTTLEANRLRHIEIVKEARENYIKNAQVALEEKLKKLEAGEVVNLNFNLSPPQDHTKEYDVAIKMLQIHVDETLILDFTQVKNLIMDDWTWVNYPHDQHVGLGNKE